MLSRRNFMATVAACAAGAGALSLRIKPLSAQARDWLRPPRVDVRNIQTDTYRDLVGTHLTIHTPGRPATRARLADVADLKPGGWHSPGRLRQISLLFEVPSRTTLSDGMHRIDHPLAGSVDLYLSAVGPTGRTRQFEAVITRLA